MSRLRYNNSVGTLGGSLTSTGTTITFGVAPVWSTIVAPDYIPLVLEPPGAAPSANFEVVYVTAFAAGATTATIVRAQEGTTPVSHSSGVAWMVAPTTSDFPTGLTYTPATAPPPSRAFRTAALSITSAGVKVPVDTIDFDPNGYFDVTTNHRYNVPNTGTYLVVGAIDLVGGPTSEVQVYIKKNGVTAFSGTDNTGYGGNVVGVLQCNAGDYLELWAFSSSTQSIQTAVSAYNSLAVTPLTQQSIASQITPVAARAFRNAAFSFATSTFVKVPIDTLSFDTGSGMDATTNHRYNIPVSGYYQVEGNINATDSTTYAALYKNGVRFAESGAYGAGGQGGGVTVVSDVVQCQAGDFIELWVFSSSGAIGVGPGTNTNYLSVSQVSGVPGANLAAARAYRNAALSVTANNWNKVPLDTKSFDPNGNMDVVTNGRYNVPAAGPYLVVGNIEVSASAAWAGLYKNGSAWSFGSIVNSGSVGVSTAVDIIQCNAGDYLELWVQPASGTSLNVGNGTGNNFLSVTPLVSAVASTPGFSSSGSSSAATNVARAYRNAALTLTAANYTKIPLDTTSFDPVGSMDVTTNHRFNAPVTGYYNVQGQVELAANGSSIEIEPVIYKNGSLFLSGGDVSNRPGSTGGGTVGDVLYLNAGDYLELWCWCNVAQALLVGPPAGGYNYLSAALIQAPSGSGNANALPAGASYQNGVINSTDLAISALSINTSTGALTFTLASAVPVIIKDASGLLIPVTFTGSTFTLIPPTLPTTSNSRVMGVEVDANGQVSLVSGASVAGQQSTASTLETNTASITPGRLRVADIGVYNNAGAYNFSNASTTATQGTNWVDRRPWARGALQIGNSTGSASSSSTSYSSLSALGANNITPWRIECTGVPIKVTVCGRCTGVASEQLSFRLQVDGVTVANTMTADIPASGGFYETPLLTWRVIPSVGSHLIDVQMVTNAGGVGSIEGPSATFEEIVRQNANNGTV